MANFNNIDEYIALQEEKLQEDLQCIRQLILSLSPDITEKISWKMPTFAIGKNIAHFFVHKNHIGFYPSPEAIEHFKAELDSNGYKYSKGAVQFPFSRPIPYDIIENMVKFNISQLTQSKN